MMVCRELCKKLGVRHRVSSYTSGLAYCSHCEIYFDPVELKKKTMRCPCCNQRLRVRPRMNINSKRIPDSRYH